MLEKIKHHLIITRFVKYSLLFLVIITIIVVGYYIFINQDVKLRHANTPSDKSKSNNEINLKINNPGLIGINLEHGPYYINADEMQESSGYVSFILPKVKLMINHVDWLHLLSKTARLTISDNHLELFNDVKANINQEYYFEGDQAEIIKNENIIRSDTPVILSSAEAVLKSEKGFIMNYKDETAMFHGKINADIKQKDDKYGTNIKSDKLDVFMKNKIGNFLGHVVLLRNGTTVEADKMTVMVNPKTDKIDKIFVYSNVKITDKDNVATSEYGEYIVSTSILTLKDQVKLYRDNHVLSGELLHYNFNTKKADLVGSPDSKANNRVKATIIPKNK